MPVDPLSLAIGTMVLVNSAWIALTGRGNDSSSDEKDPRPAGEEGSWYDAEMHS
jgi:hypothetical protein